MNTIIKLLKLSQKLDENKMYKIASGIDLILQKYMLNNILTQCAWCNLIREPNTGIFFWDSSFGEPRNLSEEGVAVSHAICQKCKEEAFPNLK